MSKRILIIDDDTEDLILIKKALEDDGFQEILTASLCEDGIGKAKEMKPDIIVIDTRLPGMDGFEICQEIRKTEGYHPKIVITTGNIDAVDAAKARKAGADDYCVKTSDYQLLRVAVSNLTSE